MFAQFEKEGVMNKELGKKYRELILAPGGSADSIEGTVAFLGREPNNDAFMKMNGFN
jgi:Zn-dependent oligopeptidase